MLSPVLAVKLPLLQRYFVLYHSFHVLSTVCSARDHLSLCPDSIALVVEYTREDEQLNVRRMEGNILCQPFLCCIGEVWFNVGKMIL